MLWSRNFPRDYSFPFRCAQGGVALTAPECTGFRENEPSIYLNLSKLSGSQRLGNLSSRSLMKPSWMKLTKHLSSVTLDGLSSY